MELNQQASFIPKKPIVSQPEVGYGEGGFSVVTFISVILFVLSLSLAAGVTLYQSVKIKQLADKEASYKKAINDPNQAPNINKWREMDERLQQASQLLENHISMNAFLAKIEFQTVKNVQFTSIDVNPADQSGADNSIIPKTFKVTFEGIAPGYVEVIQQSDIFAASKNIGISNPSFDLPVLDDLTGKIKFKGSFYLDKDSIKYAKFLEEISSKSQ